MTSSGVLDTPYPVYIDRHNLDYGRRIAPDQGRCGYTTPRLTASRNGLRAWSE